LKNIKKYFQQKEQPQEQKKESETEDTQGKTSIKSPKIYNIKSPAAGNYPQGLYKYPYKPNSITFEQFTQTLEWFPEVKQTFAKNTQYTAVLTLVPASSDYTFKNVCLDDVTGLPFENISDISSEISDDSMIIKIVFEKTSAEDAEAQLIFYDDFEGDTLDTTKWNVCPLWDRQGRSTWSGDMVSVGGGYLHLAFKRDTELGRSKSSKKSIAENWIKSGGIRSRAEYGDEIIFENTFGYYEAGIKFPKVKGMWGAFWLMTMAQLIITDDAVIGAEIDIIETMANPIDKFSAAYHWNGYGKDHRNAFSGDIKLSGIDIYDGDFHVIGLDWSPGEYIFYVDGTEFWRCDGGEKFSGSGINRNPNYIKLTVEGADFAGALPIDFTEGEMLVDYVRVYNQPKPQVKF